MVGRKCENKAALPAIEQGVAGVALGGPFLGAAHDVEKHEWWGLPSQALRQGGRLSPENPTTVMS